jgi:hypothetical protein
MTTNGALPHIDLNALVTPVAKVTLDDNEYDVLPVQGEAMAIFEAMLDESRERKGQPAPSTDEQKTIVLRELDRARRIVRAVAPKIPMERIKTMTAAQLTAIAGLSMDAVRRVQDLRAKSAGKEGGPATKRPRTRPGRR